MWLAVAEGYLAFLMLASHGSMKRHILPPAVVMKLAVAL